MNLKILLLLLSCFQICSWKNSYLENYNGRFCTDSRLRIPDSLLNKLPRSLCQYNHRDQSADIFDTLRKTDELALPIIIQDINKFTVSTLKDFIIFFYGDRFYARFYALETIARVPYFSFGL